MAFGIATLGIISIGVVPMGILSLGVLGMGVINACSVGMGVLVAGMNAILRTYPSKTLMHQLVEARLPIHPS